MDEEYEYTPTNRVKKRSPKTGKFWCMPCDMALVGHGQRCPKCKCMSLPRRDKR